MSRYSSGSDTSSRRRKSRRKRSQSTSSSSSSRYRRSRKSKRHSSSYKKSKSYSSKSHRSHSRSVSKDRKHRRSHSRSKDKYQSKHHHKSRSHSKGHTSKYYSRSSSNDTHSRQSRSPACSNSSSSSGSKKTTAPNLNNSDEQLREKLLKAIKAAESADHQLKQQGVLPKGIKSRNDLSSLPPSKPQAEVIKAIEKDEFIQKSFTSSKKKTDDVIGVTEGSTLEDAYNIYDIAIDSIFHPSFFYDPKAKLERWVKKLYQFRQRAITDPVENK